HASQPIAVVAGFGHVEASKEALAADIEVFPEEAAKRPARSERHRAHELSEIAGGLAFGVSLLGFVFAYATYYRKALDPGEAKEQFPGVYALLANKWYFDALYSVLLVRPAVIVAWALRFFDLKVIDGVIHGVARGTVFFSWLSGLFDNRIID